MVALLVLSTAPTMQEAESLAHTIVKERLAACVNVLPGIQSHFRWEGKQQSTPEVLLLIKTTASRFKALKKRIQSLHSYDTPEILAFHVKDGNKAYLKWLEISVTA